MSASSIGRFAAMRTAQIRTTSRTTSKAQQRASVERLAKVADSASETSLGKIAAYIPSEAVTLYIGALAVMAGVTSSAERTQGLIWSAVGVGVINALLILLSFMQTTDGRNRRLAVIDAMTSWRFWLALAIGTAALAVYMVVLPGNPFITEGWWSALIVLFAGVAIPLIASLVGVVPVPADGEATVPPRSA